MMAKLLMNINYHFHDFLWPKIQWLYAYINTKFPQCCTIMSYCFNWLCCKCCMNTNETCCTHVTSHSDGMKAGNSNEYVC